MSLKSNTIKALGLGVVITVFTAGAALAAVATSTVNVRTGPSTSYRAIDQLFPGEVVGITDRAGAWCEVTHPGRDGWVNCAYLSRTGFDEGPRIIVRPGYDRYDRYHRYDRYDRGPSFGFSFGDGGVGVHVGPPPPPRPWWY